MFHSHKFYAKFSAIFNPKNAFYDTNTHRDESKL